LRLGSYQLGFDVRDELVEVLGLVARLDVALDRAWANAKQRSTRFARGLVGLLRSPNPLESGRGLLKARCFDFGQERIALGHRRSVARFVVSL
jgi:hypothetical protein